MKLIHLLCLGMLAGCNQKDHVSNMDSNPLTSADATYATYVGAIQCASCHKEQYDLWRGSHHDLAMQLVDDATVLGNFDNAVFDYFGTVSRFFKKDEQFIVRTDGPDGRLADYPVAYVFGFYPLQQYLIRFPKGHFQVLSIAWDARSKAQGGQRWFHLYPDEHIEHGDELHWTGINHNWNYMCADCHSTNLQKNYKLATQSYQTNWSEIDVSCEACHGPASQHVAWAGSDTREDTSKGLSVEFSAS